MSSAARESGDTPMMQQYQRMKAEAPGAILFFRLGDFYEMFFEDAVTASKVLEITLTARGRESGGQGFPMCGVPVVAAEGHLARLVRRGFRVAICEQVEDPKLARGVVRREIVRIVTPGTAAGERHVQAGETSFVTAILLEQGRVGCAHAEVSTGELRFSEHDPVTDREDLLAELAAFSPREVLVASGTDPAPVRGLFPAGAAPPVSEVDAWTFSRQQAKDVITEQYRVASLAAHGLEQRPLATRAVGAVLAYLRHTQRASLAHLEPPRRVDTDGRLVVDATTQRNLELVQNLRDGSGHGTLLEVMDRTHTAMGARLLRSWVLAPLRGVEAIAERLDAVEALVTAPGPAGVLAAGLRQVGDLERLLSRAVMGHATPRDLHAIASSLAPLQGVATQLGGMPAEMLHATGAAIDPHEDLRADLAFTLVDSPPATTRDGGFIREGRSPELDELHAIARDGRSYLSRLEARERERTGIASLKVRHNKVFGYYIEISNANLERAPEDYVRKQTLSTGERYVTPELKEMEQSILHAHDRAVALEQELFAGLVARVAARAESLRTTARAVGTADALLSLASAAGSHGWVRPRVEASRALEIRGGRHPVVELMDAALSGPGLGDGRFVPNDTDLDGDLRQVAILTGPNMGGKSTYLRQVALVALMAHAGSFVPAESARMGLVDKIFARVGASDSLATGQSTFMVEMTETARILHEATDESLVVLDEIGRGTATFDGLSIAWAVVEHLHESPRARPRTLFATHYHELTELASSLVRVRNYRMATREWNDEIVFLHRLEEGAGDRSYGIQVARLAGLPKGVVLRAKEVLENLVASDLDPTGQPRLARTRRPRAGVPPGAAPQQLSLFGGGPDADPRLRELAERLAAVDTDGLTPREALDLLAVLVAAGKSALI
jgi:DNA mismatch repair protein MutS